MNIQSQAQRSFAFLISACVFAVESLFIKYLRKQGPGKEKCLCHKAVICRRFHTPQKHPGMLLGALQALVSQLSRDQRGVCRKDFLSSDKPRGIVFVMSKIFFNEQTRIILAAVKMEVILRC